MGDDLVLNTGMEKSSSIKRLSKSIKFSIVLLAELGSDFEIVDMLYTGNNNIILTVRNLQTKYQKVFNAFYDNQSIIVHSEV